MTPDEKAIIDYLKSYRNVFVGGREIARKVGGKKRYEEDKGWAVSILAAMVQAGLLEADFSGHFRLKPYDDRKKKTRAYVSPHVLRILRRSGKKFDAYVLDEDEEEADKLLKPDEEKKKEDEENSVP